MGESALNCYQEQLDRLASRGLSADACAAHLTETYLDGKPRKQGKRNIGRRERDRQFWSLDFWRACSPETWKTQNFELALSRYLAQEAVAAPDLLHLIAQSTPETVHHAARHSFMVLNPTSPRRTELEAAANLSPVIHELCQVLLIFEKAHNERLSELHFLQTTFNEASAFDLLLLSSLYAFKHLIPKSLGVQGAGSPHSDQVVWNAVNDLLIWKLRTQPEAALQLDDQKIGASLAAFLRPLLFGGDEEKAALSVFGRFESLMDAQIELNEFKSHWAKAFSYDDSIQFVRKGDRLEIQEIDSEAHRKWERDGRKQELLHHYWFYRALNEFAQSEVAGHQIGSPENHDANQLAWISALRAQLQLREVYGVSGQISLDSGVRVPVFQAMLCLELMSAHFLKDFLVRYTALLASRGDWILALRDLALEGLSNGMQIRFPLTWSDRDAKIAKITGWTVSPEHPGGSARMASSMLDFWSFDMQEVAARLRSDQSGLKPTLFERPVLKFGSTYVQLPWVVGVQNRSTAVINNLRRLGADRAETRVETQLIEESLASLLRSRGFCVVLNWNPPEPWREAGEVDVIAARDGHLFVMEVKSTFVRGSMRDAWLHATTALRKAGRQVEKKLQAVCAAMESGLLTEQLGITGTAAPSRSESALNNPTQEKSGTLAPHQDSVAVKIAHGRCLLNGAPVAKHGYQVLTLEQACAVHADALLVVENLESFRFLERNRWIDYQGKAVLAVFRGDNVLKTNVAIKLIASRAEPVWAYFDFDPAGMGMASALPRLKRLVLPEEEALTSATRRANQAHLYADQLDQWEPTMQSAEHPVFERPWKLLRQLRLGLAQEHMDSLD